MLASWCAGQNAPVTCASVIGPEYAKPDLAGFFRGLHWGTRGVTSQTSRFGAGAKGLKNFLRLTSFDLLVLEDTG